MRFKTKMASNFDFKSSGKKSDQTATVRRWKYYFYQVCFIVHTELMTQKYKLYFVNHVNVL